MKYKFQHNQFTVEMSLKPASFTVMKTDAFGVSELMSFDRAGRLLGAFFDGINYRRGLDNQIQLRFRQTKLEPEEKMLNVSQSQEIIQRVCKLSTKIAQIQQTNNSAIQDLLEKACSWDWQLLQRDGKKFTKLCGRVPILPPDQYRALVIRLTTGCSHNQCTFCNLYENVQFRSISETRLVRHLENIVSFYGEGMSYRKSIFLGDANAVALATDLLINRLEVIRKNPNFSQQISGGFASFVDVFTSNKKSVSEYTLMKNLGLRRIALGIETGDKTLLKFVNKPGKNNNVLHLITTLKDANISVTPIFMIGLGGKSFRKTHRKKSVELIRSMNLDTTDIVYLSQIDIPANSTYQILAKQKKIFPLNQQSIREETQIWENELSNISAKIVPYNFRRFVY